MVTGGAGFVGANLVRMLLDAGRQVTVIDDLSAGRLRYLEGLRIEFIRADICDGRLMKHLALGHDSIVHLAAQTGIPASIAEPSRDCRVNVQGTVKMLEAARAAGARRFVLASSNAAIGRQTPPAAEDLAPLPVSPYGASKLAAEGYCLAYHGSWGLNAVALRFGNLYGPFSAHKNSVVAKFIKDASAGRPLVIDGDGQQTRDFIHVGDVCRAAMMLLECDIGGEIFQIASGIETTILQLTQLIGEMSESDLAMEHGPARPGDVARNYSMIAKAQRMLGWRPLIDLRTGLSETWNWFNALSTPLQAAAGG
jgi:UDP-glucose 4-epimerase